MTAKLPLLLLLLLPLALVVSGCPISDDDDDDDDDDSAAADDDDDSVVTVTGAVVDVMTHVGIPDTPVSRSNGDETLTDAWGEYTFGNPTFVVESFTATAPDLPPSRVWTDTAHQRQGLIHPLFDEQMLNGFAMVATGSPWDSSLGLVIVQLGPDVDGFVGTSIDLSSSYTGAAAMDEGSIAPGNTLLEGSIAIAFFGVEPGSTTVQLTLPGEETCNGADEIVVEGGVVDNLRFICQ